ncbi:MAG: hypothetical protein EB015_09970 [Methylocystaceae bacterium]|nr:hypothetical protein [Methylocystaceae bacterium]
MNRETYLSRHSPEGRPRCIDTQSEGKPHIGQSQALGLVNGKRLRHIPISMSPPRALSIQSLLAKCVLAKCVLAKCVLTKSHLVNGHLTKSKPT